MKTIFIAIAFLVILSASAFAQLEKGSWIGGVSGNIGYSYSSSSVNHVFSFGINPYAMYLVHKNIAVGLNLDSRNAFGKSQYVYVDGQPETIKHSYNSLLVAPIVRLYFGSRKFRPYVGVATGFAMTHEKFTGSTLSEDSKYSDFGFFLNPELGASYWLNDRVFLDAKASYDLIKSDRLGGYRTLDIKIGVGLKLGK